MEKNAWIRVRGARTHNLKNLNVDVPKHRLVVITGLSGSGKSSLAFDTLYAEGQRRYVESLSAYARQFLQLMDKPDVDLIEGLSPAISIEQKATSHNPRSTVGTVTEIHDYLRLLFARIGVPYCPEHDLPLHAQTVSQMVSTVLAWPEDTRVMLLAPIVEGRKGEHAELVNTLRAQGFIRVRVNDQLYDLDAFPTLEKNKKHNVDIVIDRLKVRAENRQRFAESFETALRQGNGRVKVVNLDASEDNENTETVFSERHACPICNWSLTELEPRLFSFNSPAGACPTCDGLGVETFFDPERFILSKDLSLRAGAIKGWDARNTEAFARLESLAKHYGFSTDAPLNELSPEALKVVLYGTGREKIMMQLPGARGKFVLEERSFEGIVTNLARRYRESHSPAVQEELARYQAMRVCQDCHGSRLKAGARHVKVADYTLHQVNQWSLKQALEHFQSIGFSSKEQAIADKVLHEIRERLRFLNNVGLDYLSLERSAETLSGGEAQRIRLASQIGSGLTGVMYVLDEPSIGLHQRDNDRLIETLRHLRDLGNTVVVVEHDEDAIRAADYVIDMGPGAGVHGGEIIAEGKPEEIIACEKSLTGRYLSGVESIHIPDERHPINPERILRLQGASGNNLKSVSVDFPLGLLICVTGVSGSGKSTLINDTLHHALARHFNGSSVDAAPYQGLEGLEHIDKIISVDQSPIGRTPRSNPATYTGLFTPIREIFSQTNVARERGYGPGRFSFNVKGGRCEACEGDGVIKVEMHFLPDVYVPCDVCLGKRYNRETLDVQYRGKNIHEILSLTVEDARVFFDAIPVVKRKLQTLVDVGLGYITLGQSATTLSGGEAQRVKLALELSKRDTGRTLYLLDEPTTGLHFHDIALLLSVLERLKAHGNTIIVIEHNLDVIKTADWIIDMGPEGGAGGGQIVAEGTPEAIAECEASHTGKYLKPYLDKVSKRKAASRKHDKAQAPSL
ncbi:MAG: excinuclease ABC subunit UvrA [Pseudomonadota bacterium]